MDEPLIHDPTSNSKNTGASSGEKKEESFLLGLVKRVIDNVNEDMSSIDYTINTLLFGHQFDLLFIEHDHSHSLEWQKFRVTSDNKTMPHNVQDAVLKNDLGVAALYSQAKTKGILEETFWLKWQFFRFLQDQRSQKSQSYNSDSTLLSSKLNSIEELEDWD